MRSLESFEVEQILGPPISFQVMATWIYATFYQQTPRIDAASALAVVLVACMLLFVVIQQRFIGKRRYTTVTGQFQGQIFRLGAAKVPALVFMGIIMFLIMGVPFVFATMGTFMKLFGYFTADPWTLQHWQTAFREPLLLRSLQNTLILASQQRLRPCAEFADCLRDRTDAFLWTARPGLHHLAALHRAGIPAESWGCSPCSCCRRSGRFTGASMC